VLLVEEDVEEDVEEEVVSTSSLNKSKV